MDERTKKTAISSTLTLIVGLITGILNIVTEVPPLVAKYPHLLLLALAAAILVALATERERLSRWVRSRPVPTSAVLAGLLIIVPPSMGHGVYRLDAAANLQIATLCGTLAITMVVLLLSLESFRRGTTYNGLFPDNIPDIIDLLDGAQSSVTILTDVVAYGAFSAPVHHEKLIRKLINKRREDKVTVTWRSYDEQSAKQHVRDQLRLTGIRDGSKEEQDFLKGKSVDRFLDTFQGYVRPSSIEEFLDNILLKRNADVAGALTDAGADVSAVVSAPIPIYFWIIDNRRAILSFPCKGADGLREDTFVSNDHSLIAMLRDIYRSTGESR